MGFGVIIDRFMTVLAILGIVLSFRYLDGRALARKKFRKPKYKQFKID